MLPAGQPKFKRRKADRPEEIVAAAMGIFAEKGFAAARLDDIAARAGVSKGALYLYFATKEDLFRAVIEQGVAPNLGRMQAALVEHRGAFPELLRAFAAIAVGIATETPVGGIAKMVIEVAELPRAGPRLARTPGRARPRRDERSHRRGPGARRAARRRPAPRRDLAGLADLAGRHLARDLRARRRRAARHPDPGAATRGALAPRHAP